MEEYALPFLKVIRPGTWISVQDKGRPGYRHFGVPASGAMDQESYARANYLTGNTPEHAALEIIGPGTMLEIMSDARIVCTGATADVFLGDQKLPLETNVTVQSGQVLSFGSFHAGRILYLSVSGGISAPEVMGSRSAMPNFQNPRPEKGSLYYMNQSKSDTENLPATSEIRPDKYDDRYIHVWKGPEYHWLTASAERDVENELFTISNQSNRMGFRFTGPALHKVVTKDMLTSAVLPGTIQLLPDGQIIALMRDAQTTGGYPRILQITERDINTLAQKRPGEGIRFAFAEKE
jgi:antagonist of KipI